MNLRMRENPWRLMLAVNAAVLIGVFLYKITREPYVPYIHLLVDYHFGFTKRALIGAVVSLFFTKVPVWLVFALCGRRLADHAAGLFVKLFRRTFGFDDEHLPLFVFMAGSPFFLKNFMHTLGHFDIYGCAFAICLLLVPARSIAVRAARSASLDDPHPDPPHSSPDVCADHRGHRGAALLSGAGLSSGGMWLSAWPPRLALRRLFVAAQFLGTMAVPEAEFVQYLQGRMADPSATDLLSFSYIWYQPLSKEYRDTWERLPSNMLGVPVFALLIWLHTPALAIFCRFDRRAIAIELHRRSRHRRPSAW